MRSQAAARGHIRARAADARPERRMEKTQDAFRTIGEVAEELDLPQHVLRFWETKFTQIRPVKRAGGRRYYRPDDVQLVAAIRILLYSEGYTIKGVQRIMKEQGARALVAASRTGGHGPAAPKSIGGPSLLTPPETLSDLLLPLGAAAETQPDIQPDSAAPPARESHAGSSATILSAQDRHRMEAILAELGECARLLDDARRR
jgi:DNA-binding transcriptional MerR regulator